MNRTVFRVALLMGLFGLLVSRKQVLEWVAGQSAFESMMIWYAVFGVFITLLGYTVFNMAWNPRYTLALLIVTWALGIILYWPVSSYSTGITGAQLTGVESATEDAVTMDWLRSMGISDSSGIITYAIVPALLILLAGLVVAPNLFNRIFKSTLGRA